MKYDQFRIGFDPRDKKRVFECWDEVFASQNGWKPSNPARSIGLETECF